MKQYYTPIPQSWPAVQWDGTNIQEFEDTLPEWVNQFFNLAFTDNDGVLEVQIAYSYDPENWMPYVSVQEGEWFDGGNVRANAIPDNQQALPGDGPWTYDVTEEA